MNSHSFIQAYTLHRHFQMGTETVHALDGIDVTIDQGEFMGIVGPSGSGKSTLLYLIGGLDQPTSGEIWVDGLNIAELDENGLAHFRQKSIGFIFQSFNLIATMTALQNVEFPMLFARVAPKERQERAKHALEIVGLGDRIQHKPTELSGGQQQRVSIARSLVNNPAIILADEPTGNLDSKSGGEVINILRRLNQEENRTIIMVTHDQSLLTATTRHIQLLDGRVLADVRGSYEQQTV
jgi:putative ABC transport system ATP-binding protein